jgi:preprotein translocase subunit YajC
VPEELVSLLPIVGIALLFWLLIIRPASRRQRELRRLQDSLNVGDEVMLTSGIYGRLTTVDDDNLHVAIADGVEIKIAKGAIASIVRPEPAEDEYDEPETEPETGPETEPETEPVADDAEER